MVPTMCNASPELYSNYSYFQRPITSTLYFLLTLPQFPFQRIQTWGILTDWQLHLLIQKSLESFQGPMLPSDAVRRVFSAVAGGVLLKGGLGIRDPCEPGEEDAFDNLTEQDLHDLTAR